jgi:hypothetical protein
MALPGGVRSLPISTQQRLCSIDDERASGCRMEVSEAELIARMGSRPAAAPTLGRIDPSVFSAGTMGLRQHLVGGDQ